MTLIGLATPDLDAPFDYVVVGGGTAGLTVASRLSEDLDARVLVVEAGRDGRDDPLILTPGCLTQLYGKDEYDWNFRSVPQVCVRSSSSSGPTPCKKKLTTHASGP